MDRSTETALVFQEMASEMYDDRLTIRRRASAKDAGGGNLARDQILASNVPCRIKPSTASERDVAGAKQGSTAYTVRMPRFQSDQPVTLDSNHFLDIAARGEVEAHTLSVVAPLPDSGTIDAVAVRQS